MGLDFEALMANVKTAFTSEKKEKKDYNDPRFIKVTRDENDNGSLVLRFIPDPNGVGVITKYSHFGSREDDKGQKHYFIAECPTTIGQKCPYCEKYIGAWKSNDQETIDLLRSGKRTEKYISNVVVVKDPAHPENNGKVMLYEYGFKVAQLIESALNGDPETDIKPINIYHPMEGANIRIKHSRNGKNIVMDGTQFLSPSTLVESMEDFEALMGQAYDLTEFIQPDRYESYEALEKKLFKYMNGYSLEEAQSSKPKTKPAPIVEENDAAPAPKPKVVSTENEKPKPVSIDDDEDFFASL
ncbi:MAG: hypothetical protein IE909_19135 [Campylobacterales bacterium]|nr:hypothetical protein [Campylobacterales bacterium]